MPESGIVFSDQLARATGLEKPAAIKRKLEADGIPVFMGKDGPWTTVELITAAGKAKMGASDTAKDEKWL